MLKQFNTLAFSPNSLLKMPIEPGPQTSWVIKISTLTQTFSPGLNWDFSEALAKIFSVIVNAVLTCKSTNNLLPNNASSQRCKNEIDKSEPTNIPTNRKHKMKRTQLSQWWQACALIGGEPWRKQFSWQLISWTCEGKMVMMVKEK